MRAVLIAIFVTAFFGCQTQNAPCQPVNGEEPATVGVAGAAGDAGAGGTGTTSTTTVGSGGTSDGGAPADYCFCNCPYGVPLPPGIKSIFCGPETEGRTCCVWNGTTQLDIGTCQSGVCIPTPPME